MTLTSSPTPVAVDFPKFKLLPSEIQRLIWEEAAAAVPPRVVELTLRRGSMKLESYLHQRCNVDKEDYNDVIKSLHPYLLTYRDYFWEDEGAFVDSEDDEDIEDDEKNNEEARPPYLEMDINLDITFHRMFEYFIKNTQKPLPIINSKTPIPSLLQACYESRTIASKYLELAFNTYTIDKHTYFNYDIDTLCISCDDFTTPDKFFGNWKRNIVTMFHNLNVGTERIKKLAIAIPLYNSDGAMVEEWLSSIFAIFSGVTELHLLVNDVGAQDDSPRRIIAPMDVRKAMEHFEDYKAGKAEQLEKIHLVEKWRLKRADFVRSRLRREIEKYTPVGKKVMLPEIHVSAIVAGSLLEDLEAAEAECLEIADERWYQDVVAGCGIIEEEEDGGMDEWEVDDVGMGDVGTGDSEEGGVFFEDAMAFSD